MPVLTRAPLWNPVTHEADAWLSPKQQAIQSYEVIIVKHRRLVPDCHQGRPSKYGPWGSGIKRRARMVKRKRGGLASPLRNTFVGCLMQRPFVKLLRQSYLSGVLDVREMVGCVTVWVQMQVR